VGKIGIRICLVFLFATCGRVAASVREPARYYLCDGTAQRLRTEQTAAQRSVVVAEKNKKTIREFLPILAKKEKMRMQ